MASWKWCCSIAPRRRRTALLLTLLLIASTPLDLLLLRSGAAGASWAVMVVGLSCAAAMAAVTIWLERERHTQAIAAERLHADAFQHASTSIWVEDWTEVGEVVLALRQGYADPVAYFAARPDLVERLHRSVVITDVNDVTVALLGVSGKAQLIGRLAEVVPASVKTFERWIIALARGDRFYRAESQVCRPDGTVRDCLVTAALPGDQEGFARILVNFFDVTDYKADQARLAAAERDIARASRLLTMGALTASIAHEVNNPLAAVITNAEASLRWLCRPAIDLPEVKAAITGAIEAARRAQEVVDRTRRLVTEARYKPGEFDVAETIRNVVPLLEQELRHSQVTVSIKTDPRIPRVMADAVQVQQILINLLLNAICAMEGIEGRREILVTAQSLDGCVRISVADQGIGISPEQLDRLFDPFYSTKTNGMGIGLAVCKACVEAHGGRLQVTSARNVGTTFTFNLPAVVIET
jgi:signal transduction histidine kinase